MCKQRELLKESVGAALIPASGIQERPGLPGIEIQPRDPAILGYVQEYPFPSVPSCLVSSPTASAWARPSQADSIYLVCCTPEPSPQLMPICFSFSYLQASVHLISP